MRAHGIQNYTARQKKKQKFLLFTYYIRTRTIHITYMFHFDVLYKQYAKRAPFNGKLFVELQFVRTIIKRVSSHASPQRLAAILSVEHHATYYMTFYASSGEHYRVYNNLF